MRLRSTERREETVAPLHPADGSERSAMQHAEANRVDRLIVALHDPEDVLAVQARDIQSTLTALRTAEGQAPSSIAVMAVGAVDETAILTANIAASAALSGLRTLLVDMSRPEFIQHWLLGNPAESASIDEEDHLYPFVRPTAVPNLSLLAAPAALDQARAAPFRERLAVMATHFDLCLVDASHVEDLALAASSGEVAILAVSRDATMTADLKSTINKLSMLGTPLAGTVMLV